MGDPKAVLGASQRSEGQCRLGSQMGTQQHSQCVCAVRSEKEEAEEYNSAGGLAALSHLSPTDMFLAHNYSRVKA